MCLYYIYRYKACKHEGTDRVKVEECPSADEHGNCGEVPREEIVHVEGYCPECEQAAGAALHAEDTYKVPAGPHNSGAATGTRSYSSFGSDPESWPSFPRRSSKMWLT